MPYDVFRCILRSVKCIRERDLLFMAWRDIVCCHECDYTNLDDMHLIMQCSAYSTVTLVGNQIRAGFQLLYVNPFCSFAIQFDYIQQIFMLFPAVMLKSEMDPCEEVHDSTAQAIITEPKEKYAQ
ncbi:unnamed protein product [Brugia pahangi]|uniref:Zf-RVT domain-containing protein n=1 Tax=Brugia pahangi TaxID=6280 RepID=A0A0N4TNI3_BRUPA|nr:unnamed protein product [Brugia pahangi]